MRLDAPMCNDELRYFSAFASLGPMTFIHVICDYGPGDLAFAEVIAALSAHLPEGSDWHVTSVASFDTLATGFALAQLGLQNEALRPNDTIVFANCAPREDRSQARSDNEGEGLLYGVLKNGVPIVVVNSGLSLSFVREDLKELWTVRVNKGKSQFRSRDFFPLVVGKVIRGDQSFLKQKLDPRRVVLPRPRGVIGYVDSFGNIKTTFRTGDPQVSHLRPGQRLKAEINGVERTVTVATGSFNVEEGDIAFSPGSSGHDNRYWEVFQRGGDAWRTYKKPAVGALIQISPLRMRASKKRSPPKRKRKR